MPWQETSKMEQRQHFINTVLENQRPFKDICSEFSISTKTGYKWFNRFKQDGYTGLMDHSRRPLSHPSRLSEEVVCDIVLLKLSYNHFGPKKILDLFKRTHNGHSPSLSSINRVLSRCGLVEKRKKRRTAPSGRITSKVEIKNPNDLWTIDFKGWWKSTDNYRIEPFTVRDAFSRYVLASKILDNAKGETVKQAFIELFHRYGLPRTIQSDNGSPFASISKVQGLSRLSAWLISLGILIHRSRPGHPQDNGAHERMHRDLKESVQVRFRGKKNQYQAALDIWRKEFNDIRPHEALDMKTPNELYKKSNRHYKGEPIEMDYPKDCDVRKVSSNGQIKIDNNSLFITTALNGYYVGLKVINSHEYAVYFAVIFLGVIDMKTLSFSPKTGTYNYE